MKWKSIVFAYKLKFRSQKQLIRKHALIQKLNQKVGDNNVNERSIQ